MSFVTSKFRQCLYLVCAVLFISALAAFCFGPEPYRTAGAIALLGFGTALIVLMMAPAFGSRRHLRIALATIFLIFACCALTACPTEQSTPAVPGQPPAPTASDVENHASQWLTGLTNSIVVNGPQAVSTLCQAGVMGSEECGYAAIGQALLPAFVGVAQAAIGEFKTDPTPANQAALQEAMVPVYTGAKALNTTTN